MYSLVRVFGTLIVLLYWFDCCDCSNSHWIVTQEGKINKQEGSPFDLHQSHNLFSLLDQERRIAKLHKLHQSLLHLKHEFQEIVDLDGYFVEKPALSPSDCKSTKDLWNHDLSLSTVISLSDKNVNHDDYLDPAPLSKEALPYCYKFSELQTTQSSPVDVIKKVLNNEVLVGNPEPALIAPFFLQQYEFGNSVRQALERNSTSWVIYHLATIYWRAMGNTDEAMECIKRLFQFSPKSSYDLPLLHLTNLLHRSHYIHESLMPLKDAIYMSPESGVLFYTLGKIYVSLGFLSQALRAFQTSLVYKYRYDHTLMLTESLQCEIVMQHIVHNNRNKIKLAYEKLEEFYRLLGDIYHHQVAGTPLVLDQWIQLLYSTSHHYDNKHNWIHKTHHRSKQEPEDTDFSEDFQGILEALLNELAILEDEEEDEDDLFPDTDFIKGMDLESALEEAFMKQNFEEGEEEDLFLRHLSSSIKDRTGSSSKVSSSGSRNSDSSRSSRSSFKEKGRGRASSGSSSRSSSSSSKSRKSDVKPTLSLRVKISDPLSPSVVHSVTPLPSSSSSSLAPSSPRPSSFSSSSSIFLSRSLSDDKLSCPNLLLPTTCVGPPPLLPTVTSNSGKETRQTQGQDDNAARSTAEGDSSTSSTSSEEDVLSSSSISSSTPDHDKKTKYTEAYKQMEFISYNALPPHLEEVVFPSSTSPVTAFNDPYWPNKKQCLELVEDASDHLPRFTGTFLSPEARGIKFSELITGPPSSSEDLFVPKCAEITPLPYSMAALDHLEGISDRLSLTQKNLSVEAGLKQLFISAIEDATGESFTFQQAADKMYYALKQHKYHWALYNLASIYWRTLGDGYQSVECLRRAIDHAQIENRDVGYIGMANVLHRHNYLENALITARAALDIRPVSPVGHYTLAGIYLTCGDLVATNLHLRIVLNHQPNFRHALSALKLVRCSLKFKQEQRVLEQKQQLLLAQQQLTKNGQEPTPENLKETLAKLKLKQKKRKEEMFPSEFVGEDAIKYITKIAINLKEQSEKKGDPNKESSSSSSAAVKIQPSRTLVREQLMHKATASTQSPAMGNQQLNSEPESKMEFMAKENEREEELRKKWPENLPWPTLEECKRKPPAQYMVFTSTWLSVTAKKINITDYMDFNMSLNGSLLLPVCDINFELSEVTLNHFEGMYKPALLDYIAEKGLEEVLCKLSGSYSSMDEMAVRMRLAMIKNDSNWVVSNLAALYWRIVGNGEESLQCLKHALYHAPPQHRDVAYVSLANVLYRSGYYENSAACMQLALETSPNLVVNHFTMANVLAGQGFYREAAGYYELVLYHQPEFGPASDRLRSVRCMIVLGENNISLKQLHKDKTPGKGSGRRNALEKMKNHKRDVPAEI